MKTMVICWVLTSLSLWAVTLAVISAIVGLVVHANGCVVSSLHLFITKRDIHTYFKSIHRNVLVVTTPLAILALALLLVFGELEFFLLVIFVAFFYWLFVCVAYIDVVHDRLTVFFSVITRIARNVRRVCYIVLIINMKLTSFAILLIRSVTLDLLEEGDSVIFVLVAISSFLVLVFIFIIVEIAILCVLFYFTPQPYGAFIILFAIVRILVVLVITLLSSFKKKM